jgi:hypothetical protein
LSLRDPPGPEITIRLLVKSLTVAEESIVSPPEISAPPLTSIADVNVAIPTNWDFPPT